MSQMSKQVAFTNYCQLIFYIGNDQFFVSRFLRGFRFRMKSELSNILEKRRCTWASQIVDGQLWLGSGTDAMNLEELQKRNIQHVLNVADDVPNYHQSITYLNLNIQDFGQDCGISRMFCTQLLNSSHMQRAVATVYSCTALLVLIDLRRLSLLI